MDNNRPQQAAKGSRKPLLFLLCMIGIALVVIFLQWNNASFREPDHRRPQPGSPAPTFAFPGLDGRRISLTDYKGKVVFLNIWATWCPPCRAEMPSMEKLYQQLRGEDFEILAVSIDKSGAKDIAPFMKQHNLTFPALLDTGGTIQKLYGTTGVPESFIIDRAGVVEKVIIGPIDWSTPEVFSFIRNLLRRP